MRFVTSQSRATFRPNFLPVEGFLVRLLVGTSTLRTETAASVAKRMAQALAANKPTILCSITSTVPSVRPGQKKKKDIVKGRSTPNAALAIQASTLQCISIEILKGQQWLAVTVVLWWL